MATLAEREEELYRKIGAQETIYLADEPEKVRDQNIRRMQSATDALFDYHSSIEKLEHASRMASALYPGDATMQIEHIRRYDMARQRCHGGAMRAVLTMNQICEQYGMEPFYNGDPMNTATKAAITSFSETYVASAKDRTQHLRDLYERAIQGDTALENSRYHRDIQLAIESNRAVGTLTEGHEAVYWPEYDAAKREKNPNWVEDDARKTADKKATARSGKRLDPLPEQSRPIIPTQRTEMEL